VVASTVYSTTTCCCSWVLFTRPDGRHNREYFNIAICLLGTSYQVSCCHFDGKLEFPTRYIKPEAADGLPYLPPRLLPLNLFLYWTNSAH